MMPSNRNNQTQTPRITLEATHHDRCVRVLAARWAHPQLAPRLRDIGPSARMLSAG